MPLADDVKLVVPKPAAAPDSVAAQKGAVAAKVRQVAPTLIANYKFGDASSQIGPFVGLYETIFTLACLYKMNQPSPLARRQLLAGIAALTATSSHAHAGAPAALAGKSSGAEGTTHKIVYQLNKADDAYQNAIFNSISALLTKYVDDISIVVVVWGPGIHLLAKSPKRPVPTLYQQRVRSMVEAYGVKFIACGNTMHTVGWTQADMLDFVQVEDVGAAAVMEFQQQGYAYLAW